MLPLNNLWFETGTRLTLATCAFKHPIKLPHTLHRKPDWTIVHSVRRKHFEGEVTYEKIDSIVFGVFVRV